MKENFENNFVEFLNKKKKKERKPIFMVNSI